MSSNSRAAILTELLQPAMPKEIPGFYYDTERNRYFPYRGPIPGSSSSKPKPTAEPPQTDDKLCQRRQLRSMRPQNLLQTRELCGNILSSCKGRAKFSFQAQYQNIHASQPLVWKYHDTRWRANMALQQAVGDVNTPHGLMARDILLCSGANGSLCLFEIGSDEQQEVRHRHINYTSECVWPTNLDHIARHKQLQLGHSYTSMTQMPSDVTCIKVSKKYSKPEDETLSKHFVMTTRGSEIAPGSVYLLDLSQPLDFIASMPVALRQIGAYKHTLWAADCYPDGSHAVIGTNRGASLLNMETGVSAWLLRCKSDVLSVQVDQSAKLVLCGLRNGGIVTVDTRQKQVKSSKYTPAISLPSSVCCLAPLNLSDQYFLASSMDGSVKLYDYRMIQRHGRAVQSYEGNVNTHTRIELGVDPSDNFVMSGGEDCYLRLWNIMSGELLFKDRFMSSTPSAVCWSRNKEKLGSRVDSHYYNRVEDYRWGAWLGSAEGIFYMDWL